MPKSSENKFGYTSGHFVLEQKVSRSKDIFCDLCKKVKNISYKVILERPDLSFFFAQVRKKYLFYTKHFMLT